MRALLPAVLAVLLLSSLPSAAEAQAPVRLDKIGTFKEPVYVTSPPGAPQQLVVVERYGRVRVVRRGRLSKRLLADLRPQVLVTDRRETVDQRGLFSIAFAPDYGRSGRFYVDYVDRRGRLRVDELRRGRTTRRRVLDLGPATTQHHGGQLQFGRDGLLYVSTGMNDDPTTSQDRARLGGKILRVDPRRRGATPEIYALGLRNPWRFSFDRTTGTMLIGDVGEETSEEIDVIAPGAAPGTNFGWPAHEGTTARPGTTPVPDAAPPALTYGHERGRCSVTGGYVVRDRRLRALAGRYVYGDLCTGALRSARLEGTALTDDRALGVAVPYAVSFGEDAAGRVYAVSFNGGVYRLDPATRAR